MCYYIYLFETCFIFLTLIYFSDFESVTPNTNLDQKINETMKNYAEDLAAIGLKNISNAIRKMKKKFNGFHENPRSHPDYEIEFLTFRRNRRQEILAGKFCTRIWYT